MNVVDVLNTLQEPESKPYSVRASGWLEDDVSPKDLEAIYADFAETFDTTLHSIVSVLGTPVYSDGPDRAWLDGWYPEALKFAAWSVPNGLITLALEHQDREVPVLLLLNYVSAEELASLGQQPDSASCHPRH